MPENNNSHPNSEENISSSVWSLKRMGAALLIAGLSSFTVIGVVDSDDNTKETLVEFPRYDCDVNNIPQKIVVPETVPEQLKNEVPKSNHFSLIVKVNEGDTLTSIASCYFAQEDIGTQSILISNPQISNADVIFPGQELTINITKAQRFNVTNKISLTDFADKTGFDARTLREINSIPEDINYLEGSVQLPRNKAVITDTATDIHIVKPGETQYGISAQRGTNVIELLRLNGTLPPAQDTKPGHIIIVPNNKSSTNNEDTLQSPEQKLVGFLEKYQETAKNVSEKYNVPYDAMLAQSILESGYGQSELALNANNYFGIIANELWSGETYTKRTEEVITADNLSSYTDPVVIEEYPDGTLRIEVQRDFRKYSSVEASFQDYGVKMSNSPYYKDALGKSGQEYIQRITDNNLPKYATDPEYRNKVLKIMTNINVINNQSEGTVVEPTPSEQNESSNENTPTLERIQNINLTLEGYENFIRSIDRSFMDFANTKPAFTESNGLDQSKQFEFVTLHYTTLYLNKNGDQKDKNGEVDVERLIKSMDNQAGDGCCGVQAFIDRNGAIYQLTPLDVRTMHNPPFSTVSTGVEIEAIDQQDITTEQYESAAYFSIMVLGYENKLDQNLSDTILGHAEIREIQREEDPTLDARSDFPKEESKAIRDKIDKFLQNLNQEERNKVIGLSKQ
jgi:flagellum-specific peptidoglycan hydrolase FlgJ